MAAVTTSLDKHAAGVATAEETTVRRCDGINPTSVIDTRRKSDFQLLGAATREGGRLGLTATEEMDVWRRWRWWDVFTPNVSGGNGLWSGFGFQVGVWRVLDARASPSGFLFWRELAAPTGGPARSDEQGWSGE